VGSSVIGTHDAIWESGYRNGTVRRCEGAKVRGCEGARSEGPRVRGSEGAKVRGFGGADSGVELVDEQRGGLGLIRLLGRR
jgi:hypothetical protein